MAQNKKITQLDSLVQADSNDLFPIVDVSELETKNITAEDLFSSPQPIGSSTPSTGRFTTLRSNTLQTSAGSVINEFSTDGNLTGDSDSAVPTEKAVKSYVDTQIASISTDPINVRRISSDTTAVLGDVLLVDTSLNDINISLIGGDSGRITIKKITNDTNRVIIIASAGNIDSQGQYILDGYNVSVTCVTDNIDFFII